MTDDLTADIPEELILISEFQGSLSTFSCGSDPLDEFIQEQAHEFSERLLGETWLLCDGDDVAAFYTLAPASVPNDDYTGDETPEFGKLDDIPYPIPALLIARFGVAEEYQNQSIGSTLVDYIIVWAEEQDLPFWFIQVDSKPESIGFYESLSFVTSGAESDEESITSMFYPLSPRI
ncbi:MAG: acetyltransferase [Haloquadratum walsbyi J07HQW1]|uniref:Acetyltransferase n=1 Tax=Haloquadratum walsbyi J07HQW1 TaxID=1238424 RepID=U1PEP1_9EURY|nr:MAG: acetyltransferase [Haloquadratum walsbyi J07HQW1]